LCPNKIDMDILTGLYNYQIDALRSTELERKGIVVLPTSTGKTYVQSSIIAKDIAMNSGQFRMYVINAPRIILTYQLVKEVYQFLTKRGIEARYHFTHSGSAIDERDLEHIRMEAKQDGIDIPFAEIDSTTSVNRCVEAMEKSMEQELPLIIFSTYNSAEKVELARRQVRLPISIVLNDEAHYLVQDRFFDILTILKSSRCYFFTATMRYTPSEEGRGMNNVEAYGKVLYTLTPREAIDRGKMVRPRLHLVGTKGLYSSEDYDRSLNLIISNSFIQHKKYFGKRHPNMKAKMLVGTRGSDDMKNFINSPQYVELRESGVDVFAISSNEEVGNFVNGRRVKRQEFLSILREYGKDKNKELLVLHYDILTEGIDVPGFTGCLLLRTLVRSKFYQTYGRIARLDPEDRRRLDNGEIKATDTHLMNKPYGYVILPWITETNKDDSEFMRNLVEAMREYGFDSFEDIVGDFNPRGSDEETPEPGFNEVTRRPRSTGNIINEVLSEIEDESIAKLSPLEYLEQHLEVI
jgi:superfamily II DNA or RNA helicase